MVKPLNKKVQKKDSEFAPVVEAMVEADVPQIVQLNNQNEGSNLTIKKLKFML